MKFALKFDGYKELATHGCGDHRHTHAARVNGGEFSVEMSTEELLGQGQQLLEMVKLVATEAPAFIKALADAKAACAKAKAEEKAADMAAEIMKD